MTSTVELIDPAKIDKNPDNPRLIFRKEELGALEESISERGILVPLSVYKDKRRYGLLDGERRWRCALKLGLHTVPAIVQDKPDRVTNIMMMFAIHNARLDWDPLPTAMKLEELEKALEHASGKPPTEKQLAAAASLSVGEVRRYRKILRLPKNLKKELIDELNKPKTDQKLKVDHVIEAVSGSNRLYNEGIVSAAEKNRLIRVIVQKFRTGVIDNTVAPRKLARIARAVERGEVSKPVVEKALKKFFEDKEYSIDNVFRSTVEDLDYAHATEQLVQRATNRLQEMKAKNFDATPDLIDALQNLIAAARKLLR